MLINFDKHFFIFELLFFFRTTQKILKRYEKSI